MSILLKLFLIFFKLGFFSFGGGYSMIPLIEQAFSTSGFDISSQVIANISAIAGLCPGPVGLNLAIGFGYEIGGFTGAIAAAIGVTLPSLITVILVVLIFDKICRSKYFKWALEGLTPVVVGIIAYAAVNLMMKNGMFFSDTKNIIQNSINFSFFDFHFNLPSLILVAVSFFILLKTKIHPIFLIAAGAIIGILIF